MTLHIVIKKTEVSIFMKHFNTKINSFVKQHIYPSSCGRDARTVREICLWLLLALFFRITVAHLSQIFSYFVQDSCIHWLQYKHCSQSSFFFVCKYSSPQPAQQALKSSASSPEESWNDNPSDVDVSLEVLCVLYFFFGYSGDFLFLLRKVEATCY